MEHPRPQDRAEVPAIKDNNGWRPATPDQHRSRLIVPLTSPASRRSSPRAEDMKRRPRRAAGTRTRLHQFNSLDDAVALLKTSHNIAVLTGAGISTSVGIPDFRSDKGLYNQLSKDLGITTAEEFFSKQYFMENPQEFFQYVRRVIPEAIANADGTFRSTQGGTRPARGTTTVPKFSPTHAFLAFLAGQSRLLTNYTQNIDGLELAAGVPANKFIQCHGSWDTAVCLTCGKTSAAKKYLPVVLGGSVPYCKCSLEPTPKKRTTKRKLKGAGSKRRREEWEDSSNSEDNSPVPKGLLKPDITFFEDRITSSYHARLESDKPKIDLLLIIGTSLKVAPVQTMLYEIDPQIPQIYISKERFSGALCSLPGVQVDIELIGEADLIISELCRRAGWTHGLHAWYWRQGMKVIRSKPEDLSPDPAHLQQDEPRAREFESKRTTIPQSEQLNSESPQVKIELMVGTTHQWRVVREN